jgi:hypothetical protein
MLVEDTAAYIEQLEVLIEDKRLDRQRRRVAKANVAALAVAVEVRRLTELLRALERQAEAADRASGSPSRETPSRSPRSDTREIERARRYLRAREKEFRRKRQRFEHLERRLRGAEGGRRTVTTFRLHSADHFVDFSPWRFVRVSRSQRTHPMLISNRHGRRWWWFRDRFWWDEGRMAAGEVANAVLEFDLDRELDTHLLEEARTAAFGTAGEQRTAHTLPEAVQQAVWRRDRGRCVDCGSREDVRFDDVTPGGGTTVLSPDDVQLRCRTCSALRARGLAWGRGES